MRSDRRFPTRGAGLLALALLATVTPFGGLAQAAGTLTVCTPGAPDGFDIAQYETLNTADATLGIYDQLLAFKPGTAELGPGLAERWDVSADGLTVTLHLRRGVKFHTTPWFTPTRDFEADDVIWSVARINDATHPAHGVAPSGYVYWAGMSMPSLLRSVTKLDAMTVRFTLSRPEVPLLSDLAIPEIGAVYSAEYGEQLRGAGKLRQLDTLPVGTGPFVFKSYQKDAVVRYAANPAYWGGAPKIDQLVFAITPDPSVRAQRLAAGECLIGLSMKRDTIAALERNPALRIVRNGPLVTSFVVPNTRHRFVADRGFREALGMAIDRATLRESVYGGAAEIAGSFLPLGMWSHDAALQSTHDLAAARARVKASGYDGSVLSLFVQIGGSVDTKHVAELLQADWAGIGVTVRVVLMEQGELVRRANRGDHDLALWSWISDNADPDNFFTPNLSCAADAAGGNKSHWCSPAFDALLDAARKSGDRGARDALYRKAQRIVFDEAVVLPIVYPVVMTALHRRVKGFVPNPLDMSDFRNVSLD